MVYSNNNLFSPTTTYLVQQQILHSSNKNLSPKTNETQTTIRATWGYIERARGTGRFRDIGLRYDIVRPTL